MSDTRGDEMLDTVGEDTPSLVAQVRELQRRINSALDYIDDSSDDPALNIWRILSGEDRSGWSKRSRLS